MGARGAFGPRGPAPDASNRQPVRGVATGSVGAPRVQQIGEVDRQRGHRIGEAEGGRAGIEQVQRRAPFRVSVPPHGMTAARGTATPPAADREPGVKHSSIGCLVNGVTADETSQFCDRKTDIESYVSAHNFRGRFVRNPYPRRSRIRIHRVGAEMCVVPRNSSRGTGVAQRFRTSRFPLSPPECRIRARPPIRIRPEVVIRFPRAGRRPAFEFA